MKMMMKKKKNLKIKRKTKNNIKSLPILPEAIKKEMIQEKEMKEASLVKNLNANNNEEIITKTIY